MDAMKSCLFQDLASKLQSVMDQAKEALDASGNADGTTADKLKRVADELQETVESVVPAGLAESHPLVVTATELGTSLRDKCILIQVSALHAI